MRSHLTLNANVTGTMYNMLPVPIGVDVQRNTAAIMIRHAAMVTPSPLANRAWTSQRIYGRMYFNRYIAM